MSRSLKRLGLAGIACALTMLTLGAGSASALLASNTSVGCVPSSRAIGQIPTVCTATVGDQAGLLAPTGSVAFASDDPGIFSLSPTAPSCTLVAIDADSAGCQVAYEPTAVGDGSHIITASYGGSLVFDPSANLFFLTVTAAPADPPVNPPANMPAGGVTATGTPGTAPAKKKCKKGRKLRKGKCVKKK